MAFRDPLHLATHVPVLPEDLHRFLARVRDDRIDAVLLQQRERFEDLLRSVVVPHQVVDIDCEQCRC